VRSHATGRFASLRGLSRDPDGTPILSLSRMGRRPSDGLNPACQRDRTVNASGEIRTLAALRSCRHATSCPSTRARRERTASRPPARSYRGRTPSRSGQGPHRPRSTEVFASTQRLDSHDVLVPEVERENDGTFIGTAAVGRPALLDPHLSHGALHVVRPGAQPLSSILSGPGSSRAAPVRDGWRREFLVPASTHTRRAQGSTQTRVRDARCSSMTSSTASGSAQARVHCNDDREQMLTRPPSL
jgi:hypothetical protein